jgi:uncharacterized delta-60 repeat protein
MQRNKKTGSVLLSVVAALWLVVPAARPSSLVDKSFNPGSGADGFVETVLAQPDGKVLICGNFTHFNGVPFGYMGRLNPDGSIDTSFSAHPSYWVRTMALQSDGKIIIAGYFHEVEGQPRNTVARLNSDGSLDSSFNPGTGTLGSLGTGIDGKTNEYIFATAVQSDGKVLITGNFTNFNGVRINGLARLNSDGSLDTSFDEGDGLNTWGRSLTLLSDGRFIVTGWFNHYHNADHSRMAIVSPDGTADSTFAPNFGDQTAVYSAIPLPNGKFIVSGHSENIHQIFAQDIARLNADGSFDNSFVGTANDKTEMVRLQSDGKILLCGYFGYVDGQPRTSVARLNSDGTLDSSFNVNVDNFAWSMFIQPDGRILVAGAFHTVDGFSRNGIVRLFPSEQPEDTVPPTLIVTTPAQNVNTIASGTLTMSGTADDTNGVQSVSVTVNGDSIPVSGTTSWSATATLLPGTNVVFFTATDTFGNAASLTRYLFHTGKWPVSITTDGNGTIAPNLNNAMLQVGHAYTATAIPKPGYVFGSWSGSVNTNVATISFMMNRGMSLHASFVLNPFTNAAGLYRGLIFDTSSPKASTAGTVLLTLLNNGSYTARLLVGGLTYAIKGQFDMNLSTTTAVSRGRGKTPLQLTLQITDAQTIQGTVSDGSFTSTLTAYRSRFDVRHPAIGRTGLYTVLIPAGGAQGSPTGYGFMNISVAASGSVVLTGALADGTPVAEVTPLGSNGEIPFYFAFNGGATFGWLTLTPNGSSDTDVQGTLHWEKSLRTNLLFSVDRPVMGSVYHAPHAGTPVLALSNPTLQVDGGPLTNPLSDSFTIDSHNRIVFATPNSNRFTLGIVAANGRFAGVFTDPTTRRPGVYQGVVLQKQNVGAGFFLSNRQAGGVFFGETGTSAP